MLSLKEQQRRLPINVISYSLEAMWHVHPFIADLRSRVMAFMPQEKIYNPQDLEHQILFRLTTFDPKDINDELIQFIVEEQYQIVKERLGKLNYDVDYLFRGLTGKYQDLNVNDRLKLQWENGQLVAKNNQRSFNVEFRTVHDEDIISLFSSELHYIHKNKSNGETFGLYFVDDNLPWAVETTEPSAIAKQYKRDALLANGIDPNKAVELTRFYTLPGAPINAISLMDGLIAKHYKQKGIEALYTTTMPMYSKTKATTIAGGINKPLLVKNLRHKFIPEKIQGRDYYRHVTTIPEDHTEIKIIETHPNFPTMLVVEVFRTLDTLDLKSLPILEDGTKVIYVTQRENSKIEQEIKLEVQDISVTLSKIRSIAKYARTEYLRDVIYGRTEDKKKIRMRTQDNFECPLIDVTYKHKIAGEEGIKKELEEILYRGNSNETALQIISSQGNFIEENSYEKMRVLFVGEKETEITVDVYPYGVWVEVEGEPDQIHKIAKQLGFTKKEYIESSADDLYLEWIKQHSLSEMWDVRFGLKGKK